MPRISDVCASALTVRTLLETLLGALEYAKLHEQFADTTLRLLKTAAMSSIESCIPRRGFDNDCTITLQL